MTAAAIELSPGLGSSEPGWLNARQNGVGGSGLQTANISAFFDKCHTEGKTAYFPPGSYETAAITKEYGLNIVCDPGVEFKHTGVWTFEGTLGAQSKLETEAKEGTQILILSSTAGMAAGSLLKIGTVTAIPKETGVERTRGQLVEVQEVIKAGEVKLREALYRTFTTFAGADKTVVNIVNPIQFSYTGRPRCSNPTEANIGFILVRRGRDVQIEAYSEGQLQRAIGIDDCYLWSVWSRSKHGVWDNATKFGYSVQALSGSCHGEVNTQTVNGAYDFTTSTWDKTSGEAYDIKVTGVNSGSLSSGAFSTHPSGHDIVFDACTAFSQIESGTALATGFTAECPGTTFSNCTAKNCLVGYEIYQTAQSKARIFGCVARQCKQSVVIRGGVDHEISSCVFEESQLEHVVGAEGIEEEGIATKTLSRLHLHNNTYKTWGLAGVVGTKAESCPLRFTKELKNCLIQDETFWAGGSAGTSGEGKIFRIDVKPVKCVIQRCTVKERLSATEFGLIVAKAVTVAEAGEGQVTAAIEETIFRYNYVEA